MRANRIQGLVVLVPLLLLICGVGSAFAAVDQQLRTVVYRGFSVTVPRAWPVYDLAKEPHTCVRFDRHALYLGVPGTEQNCPAQPVGRTEAILIEPAGATLASAGATETSAGGAGSATTFGVPRAGVQVTATWLSDPGLVAAALHRRALPQPRTTARPHLQTSGSSGGGTPSASAPAVYTGPGFDACDAPSAQKMSAWTGHSPYHAIGIYIGGTNAACPPSSDPNLTPSWLSTEAAAGWHFIPTYVGLQAAGACGCAAIKPTAASAEGTAAADDAVAQAQSLDLPSGTPIYDDMESYSRTQSNTTSVLAFLEAWTTELHAKGYLSGVYGNANSAMADLATQYGTSYAEPDDIWFAAWPGDGATSTNDPNIPTADWQSHQRLHQYSGAHNESYGGVTINIDGDYLDGATAGAVAAGPSPPPSLYVFPGSVFTYLTASWSGLGLGGWQVLAGTSPTALTNVESASVLGAQTKIAVASAAPYFAVDATGTSGQVLATSATIATTPRLTMFGRSTFFGLSSGVGGFPVGCYLASACHLVATLSVGRTTIARTKQQTFRPGGSGIVYYKLTSAGWKLLTRAHDGHLPIAITLKDASGASASAHMTLIPFTTTGRGPSRGVTPGLLVTASGTTEPVHGWSGGILTRCSAVSACAVTPTLTVGRVTIASAAQQTVGGLEVGYVYFWLNAQGHRLLQRAAGNQLAANLVLRSGTDVASAHVVLVQFG